MYVCMCVCNKFGKPSHKNIFCEEFRIIQDYAREFNLSPLLEINQTIIKNTIFKNTRIRHNKISQPEFYLVTDTEEILSMKTVPRVRSRRCHDIF